MKKNPGSMLQTSFHRFPVPGGYFWRAFAKIPSSASDQTTFSSSLTEGGSVIVGYFLLFLFFSFPFFSFLFFKKKKKTPPFATLGLGMNFSTSASNTCFKGNKAKRRENQKRKAKAKAKAKKKCTVWASSGDVWKARDTLVKPSASNLRTLDKK